jgi:hypothetical protein
LLYTVTDQVITFLVPDSCRATVREQKREQDREHH